MRIRADFTKTAGRIKPMHGIGQPPILGLYDTMFHYVGEAGFPYSRLHDVGGLFGGSRFVDIPNLFPDFDADETLPGSYDFVFTDWLIERLMEQGCEPIFRLGVTIENFAGIKAYRVFPPKDFGKWGRQKERTGKNRNRILTERSLFFYLKTIIIMHETQQAIVIYYSDLPFPA